jgi:hypothetical protein
MVIEVEQTTPEMRLMKYDDARGKEEGRRTRYLEIFVLSK